MRVPAGGKFREASIDRIGLIVKSRAASISAPPAVAFVCYGGACMERPTTLLASLGHSRMKIAIVGGGIAGTASAWLLSQQGHRVTLFEQAPKCGPVGAGILLQPSGKAVLQRMGLLEGIAARSDQIDRLHARHRHGKTLVHLRYERVAPGLHGLGVRRGLLFEKLLEGCRQSQVEVREGHQVVDYQEHASHISLQHLGKDLGQFDLLVAADGSKSRLRQHCGWPNQVFEYPDAAVWLIGPWTSERDSLTQWVDRDGRLVGILPVGENLCSFFWGLKTDAWPATQAAGIGAWKTSVVDFLPQAEEIVADVDSIDQLTFATYRSARMRHMTAGRVVFIGDAAHATSPHLGQGLNLALQDAEILAKHLTPDADPTVALQQYEAERRAVVQFYSRLTAFLTPYFQTANPILQFGRDCALPVMPHLPWVGKQMVLTMAGLKTGWLTHSRLK